MKKHAGSGVLQGTLRKGTKPQPASTSGQFHGGTLLVKGQTHAPRPRVYGTHGGTNLPRVLNKKRP